MRKLWVWLARACPKKHPVGRTVPGEPRLSYENAMLARQGRLALPLDMLLGQALARACPRKQMVGPVALRQAARVQRANRTSCRGARDRPWSLDLFSMRSSLEAIVTAALGSPFPLNGGRAGLRGERSKWVTWSSAPSCPFI